MMNELIFISLFYIYFLKEEEREKRKKEDESEVIESVSGDTII